MTDFAKLFNNYKIAYKTKVNRGWVNTSCPYCGSSDNLGFSEEKTICSCWTCGWKPIEQAIGKILNIPEHQALQVINKYTTGRKINKTVVKHQKSLDFPGKPFNKLEHDYLISRKFNPKRLTQKYGILGGGTTGKWSYRIMIPLVFERKLISWTGRSILSKEQCEQNNIPRYYNLSDKESVVNPREMWFNYDNATSKTVILVEGPMDVLRMGDGVISGWGTTITEAQILKILKFEKVMILFDNDETGWKKAIALKKKLDLLDVNSFIVNSYLPGKDPGEMENFQANELKQTLLH